MDTSKLTEREELILNAVVHAYITSAEPVGSRAVVKRFNLDISPATVRNVMADLEEEGFLEQRHTSSGRTPTDKGYRYYVDYLMHVQKVTHSERNQLENELTARLNDADELLRQTSRMLALISHHAGIAEGPGDGEAHIHNVEIMPLQGERAVLLLADNFGRVRTRALSLEEPLTADDATRLSRFLNDNLRGSTVDGIGEVIRQKLRRYVDDQHELAQRALRVLDVVPTVGQGQLFLDGATQLFEAPEFRDIDKAREVFGLLEERDRVVELLRAGTMELDAPPSHVLIGAEGKSYGMDEVSVVSAPYRVNGKTVGRLGILGPRRMHYSRLTGVVEYTAGVVGRLLSRLTN